MWRKRLRDVYEGQYKSWCIYAEMYGLHHRLGYATPEEAWEAAPMIQGSSLPRDFMVVAPIEDPQVLAVASTFLASMSKMGVRTADDLADVLILATLKDHSWHRAITSRVLGIARRTLGLKMVRWIHMGIDIPPSIRTPVPRTDSGSRFPVTDSGQLSEEGIE